MAPELVQPAGQRLHPLPLEPARGGEPLELLLIGQPFEDPRRHGGAERQPREIDQRQGRQEGELAARQQEVAHPLAAVGGVDLDLEAPGAAR